MTAAFESLDEDQANVTSSRIPLKTGIGAVLILVLAFGSAVFWFRSQPISVDSKDVAEQPVTGSMGAAAPAAVGTISSSSVPTAGLANSNPTRPSEPQSASYAVLGRYSAFIADQDVSLNFDGQTSKSLGAASGRATYANRVTGDSCTSRLIVDQVANEMSATYSQASILGQKPCEGSFPMRISINDAATDQSGAIQNLHVEWLNPANGRVVMAGDLGR